MFFTQICSASARTEKSRPARRSTTSGGPSTCSGCRCATTGTHRTCPPRRSPSPWRTSTTTPRGSCSTCTRGWWWRTMTTHSRSNKSKWCVRLRILSNQSISLARRRNGVSQFKSNFQVVNLTPQKPKKSKTMKSMEIYSINSTEAVPGHPRGPTSIFGKFSRKKTSSGSSGPSPPWIRY